MKASGQDALRTAFEENYVPLMRLCGLLCGSRELAEDIVQEVFVRVALRIDRVAPDRIPNYLRAAVVNEWKNRVRRLAIERRFVWLHHVSVPQTDTAIEERDLLWNAVRALPNRQRACLVLRYYEGLTERETAQVLGCSVGTVKSQTKRAMTKIREALK